MNRFGVYFFYDEQGKVDDYVLTFLAAMIPNFSEIVFVANGHLEPESRRLVSQLINTTLVVRENKGFDVGAYKEVIDLKGWDYLSAFDEIILMNFTIMGPVNSFDVMFETMEYKELDFWGITSHHGKNFTPLATSIQFPRHIQSHFMAIRKSMHSSLQFKKYWTNPPEIQTYWDSVTKHEATFTEKFENFGFRSGTYVETKDLEGQYLYPLFNVPIELIENRGCPIFKRKIFSAGPDVSIQENANDVARDLLLYLRSSGRYDVGAIERNISRTFSWLDTALTSNIVFLLEESNTNFFEASDDCLIIVVDPSQEMLVGIKSRAKKVGVQKVVTITSSLEERITVTRLTSRSSLDTQRDSLWLNELDSLLESLLSKKYLIVIDEHFGDAGIFEGSRVSHRESVLDSLFGPRHTSLSPISILEDNPSVAILYPLPSLHGSFFTGMFADPNHGKGKQPGLESFESLGSFVARIDVITPSLRSQIAMLRKNLRSKNAVTLRPAHLLSKLIHRASADLGFLAGIVTTKQHAANQLSNYLHLRRELVRELDYPEYMSIPEMILGVGQSKKWSDKVKRLESEKEHYKSAYFAITKTVSWKATAPLRLVRKFISRLRLHSPAGHSNQTGPDY